MAKPDRYAISKGIKYSMFLNKGYLHQFRSLLSENLGSLDSTLFNYFHTSPGISHSAEDGYSAPVCCPQRPRTTVDNKYSNRVGYCARRMSSLSPLASLDNLDLSSRSMSAPLCSTPSKRDEYVLVMDVISAGSSSVSGGSVRRTNDSGGSSSYSSSLVDNNFYNFKLCRFYRTEICPSWNRRERCRDKPKCQYAHGKGELRPMGCMTFARTGYCPDRNCKLWPCINSTKASARKAKSVVVNRATPVPVQSATPVPSQQSSSSSSSLAGNNVYNSNVWASYTSAESSTNIENPSNGIGNQECFSDHAFCNCGNGNSCKCWPSLAKTQDSGPSTVQEKTPEATPMTSKEDTSTTYRDWSPKDDNIVRRRRMNAPEDDNIVRRRRMKAFNDIC